MGFRQAIFQTEQRVSELHARIHETLRLRDRSAEHRSKWEQACRRFHEYRSPIVELMDQCHEEDIGSNKTLREFAIDFLECDPMFFRSGYFKELLLDKLKAVKLTDSERRRISAILLDAIRRRGQREFRRYCRLAARVYDEELTKHIESLLSDSDPGVRSRAELMHGYIVQSGVPPNQALQSDTCVRGSFGYAKPRHARKRR